MCRLVYPFFIKKKWVLYPFFIKKNGYTNLHIATPSFRSNPCDARIAPKIDRRWNSEILLHRRCRNGCRYSRRQPLRAFTILIDSGIHEAVFCAAPFTQNFDQSSESDFSEYFERRQEPDFLQNYEVWGLFNGLQSGGKYRNEYIFIFNNTWRERGIDITAVRVI